MRLNHVAIAVADPERSAAFYGEYFGLDRRVHDDSRLASGRGRTDFPDRSQ
ncbi:MAG: VOC family protein [Thermoleophilaceae bacterium]